MQKHNPKTDLNSQKPYLLNPKEGQLCQQLQEHESIFSPRSQEEERACRVSLPLSHKGQAGPGDKAHPPKSHLSRQPAASSVTFGSGGRSVDHEFQKSGCERAGKAANLGIWGRHRGLRWQRRQAASMVRSHRGLFGTVKGVVGCMGRV